MARSIRFSLSRFIFHNKTAIFLIVLIIFVVLCLPKRTEDSRSHIENILKTFQNQPLHSEAEMVTLYKSKLCLTTSNESNEPCLDTWVIAALPGIDIEDHLWEYLSLLAITEVYGKNEGRKITSFLSKQSIEQLQRIFERIHFTDLGSVPDLVGVGNGNRIYFNTDLKQKSFFLLDEGQRRYKEIVESDMKIYRQDCKLNKRFEEMALLEIDNFKAQLEIMDDVSIVGMYIQTLQLPPTYYERAMDFLRKSHYNVIFLVICPTYLMDECRGTFSETDTNVIKSHNKELELAIMSMCNHTIIENDFGVLAALINQNEGDVIVYDGISSEMQWFLNYMTENFDNWYSIA